MADEEKRPEGENEAAQAGQESLADATREVQAAEPASEGPGGTGPVDDGQTAEVTGRTEDSAPLEATLPAPGDPAAGAPKEEDEEKASESELRGAAGVHEHGARSAAAVAHEPAAAESHAGGHGGGHDDHGHGHVAPMSMLFGVLGALLILTVMTVAVTAVDLGSEGNFVVAMIIATVKAALVMGYFMHLVWDSKFNVLVFLSSFLFVLLFLSLALLDRQEYQESIDEFEQTQAQAR